MKSDRFQGRDIAKGLFDGYFMLVKHTNRAYKFKSKSPDWVVYHIITPEEITKLPVKK